MPVLSLSLLMAAAAAGGPSLPAADRAAAFRAAGAKLRARTWMLCPENPQSEGARIETLRDLNGDGRPEAVLMEDGSYCYGFTGVGFALVSKQANGSWKLMRSGTGIPEFLKTKGTGGWPDMAIGGPGFCFPVERWDGRDYVRVRYEYQGRRCKP